MHIKHISDLYNIGVGQTCVIVGGGHSVNKFDFGSLPDTITVIGTNCHKNELADIIIYYDKQIKKYYEENNVSAKYIIGFRHSKRHDHTCKRCTHYYGYDDIVFGDTGFHSAQMADQMFGFSNIYLTGFDYNIIGDSYHFDEKKSCKKKIKSFQKQSINVVRDRYKLVDWENNIYNLNKNSNLKVFPYKNLTW